MGLRADSGWGYTFSFFHPDQLGKPRHAGWRVESIFTAIFVNG